MKKTASPIRSLIANTEDAEALRGAAEKIGWNFLCIQLKTLQKMCLNIKSKKLQHVSRYMKLM